MTHPLFKTNFNTKAKELYNGLVAESIEFAGVECYYLPRVIDSMDKILNEVFLAKFKEAFKISVLREVTGGFFPNDFIIQKFGAEFSGANTVFAVSKTKFKTITGQDYPTQGGLLVFPDVKQIYEIRDIDTRDPWISNGKIYYWKMSCLPFDLTKNHDISDDILDFLDSDAETIINDLEGNTKVWDFNFFTADSTCITVDTTEHLASEDMRDDYFLPVTADRTDVWASDDDWKVDIDWKEINSSRGYMDLLEFKETPGKNSNFRDEASKYLKPNESNSYGFI